MLVFPPPDLWDAEAGDATTSQFRAKRGSDLRRCSAVAASRINSFSDLGSFWCGERLFRSVARAEITGQWQFWWSLSYLSLVLAASPTDLYDKIFPLPYTRSLFLFPHDKKKKITVFA